MGVAAGFDGGLSRTLAVCLAAAGLVGIGLLVALLARGAPAPGYSASASAAKAKAGLAQAYGKLPLRFEENRGQSDPQVKFLSRGAGYSLFLTEREAVLSLIKKAKPPAPGSSAPARAQQDATAVVRMRPVGASPNARLTAGERLPGVSNYLRGGDHRRWQTGVPAYNRVRYQAVYPGVDLVYHGAQDKLEYDFVVAPGAEPGRIALSLTGAEKLTIDRRGDLILHTAAGQLRQQRPVVYQQAAGKKTPVPGRYVLLGKDRVGFSLGAYDRSRALVIDPVLAYSTYLGGSGSTDATDIAVDASGNAYVTGQTSSADFPTVGPYQSTHAGSGDVFVTKLNPAGSGLVYSTYIGGGGSDYAQAIAVDSSGNASVTGRTLSTNYPLQGATQVTNRGLGDAFVTKLNAAGSALIFSTYLGGEEFDEGRGIGVDSTGNVLLTGTTLSTTFPTTPSALQPIINTAPCGAGLPPRPCEAAFVP